jgi:hypothetical protein
MSEDAIRSMLVDVDFMKDQFESIGRPDATSAFKELRMVSAMSACVPRINLLVPDDIDRAQ